MAEIRVTLAGAWVECGLPGSQICVTLAGAYIECGYPQPVTEEEPTGAWGRERVEPLGPPAPQRVVPQPPPRTPAFVPPQTAARMAAQARIERMVRQIAAGRSPSEKPAADPVHWRAFVGPPFVSANSAEFWDWSALSLAAYEPTPADTTAPSGLAQGATTVTLATGAGNSWPSAGGFWIGPAASGEAWEYVRYTGRSGDTLTGLIRETVDAEQTGVHSAGAIVRFWWPLETATGTLQISEQMNDGMNVVGWNARLEGVRFPQAALRTGHLCLIQWRWPDGAGEWDDWENAFIGWIDSPQVRDDAERGAEWNVTVVGLDGMLDALDAPGIRVGAIDLARNGEIEVSGYLGAAYMEAGSGEFTAAQPDLSGQSAIDGDLETLWISERYIGADNDFVLINDNATGNTPAHLVQVHISPYTGQGKGYRWIWLDELIAGEYRLGNQDGVHWTFTAGGSVIIAENATLFRSEWRDIGDAEIIDTTTMTLREYFYDEENEQWRTRASSVTHEQWWDSLAPAGGAVRLIRNASGLMSKKGDLKWGTVTTISYEFSWSWVGANVQAPGPGETIRADFTKPGVTQSKDYWIVDTIATPGYHLDSDDMEWALISVEAMGLRLHADITDSAPGAGDTLYIDNAAGPSVDGLPASGTIQIGSEQITYGAKTAGNDGVVVTARGANGTTAAAHNAGDLIYYVESGVATDALPVASVTLTRPSGVPVVEDFEIYGSKLTLARTPEDDGWESDYTLIASVMDNANASYTYTLSTPTRYRHILIRIAAMGTKPYRAAVNTIKVLVDRTVYGDTTIEAGEVAETIMTILERAGIPDGAITDAGDTPTLNDYTTENTRAWQVIADLAEYAGVRVTVGRDSKITIANDPYWSSGSLPAPDAIWTRLTASEVEAIWASGRSIGQVELEWVSHDGESRGVVRYPDPATTGSVARIGPLAFADEVAAQAAARKRFWQMRRPYTVVVQAAIVYPQLRAGQIHDLEWQIDSEMRQIARSYMALANTYQITDGGAEQALHLIQVEREDER